MFDCFGKEGFHIHMVGLETVLRDVDPDLFSQEPFIPVVADIAAAEQVAVPPLLNGPQ